MKRRLQDGSGWPWNDAGKCVLKAGAVAGIGAALAIGVMELLSAGLNYPLAVIPFATSIVLVIGSPDSIPAQPRALVGGHLVATLVGLIVLQAAGPQAWAAAVAALLCLRCS